MELGPVDVTLRENASIYTMQESLLRTNDGSWSRPPKSIYWDELHRACRDRIIRAYDPNPIWGFKDPRTLLTLEGWLTVLDRAELVGIFRHPDSVARSLLTWSGFTKETACELWRKYNEKLLSYHEQRRFPVLNFDEPPAAFREKVRRVCARLNLESNGGSYFRDELRHHQSSSPELPPGLRQLYERLCDIAV